MFKKVVFLMIAGFVSSISVAADSDMKTTTETFKDWQLVCVEQTDKKVCEMKQTLVNDKNQVVSVISLAKNSATSTMLQIALPHMVDLGVPVYIETDGAKVADLSYKFCNQVACFVVLDNDQKMLNAFIKANKGLLKFQTVAGQSVSLNFSLNGFSGALGNLSINK